MPHDGTITQFCAAERSKRRPASHRTQARPVHRVETFRDLIEPSADRGFLAHHRNDTDSAVLLSDAMTDDIPFDRTLDLTPGQPEEVMPGVRRLLCNNPSPFTFKGTVSYIVGRGQVAIIDPGPDDENHIAALLDAVRDETVTHIFVTHTHRDHSPAAARIKAATGAITVGEGPHRASRPLQIGEAQRLDASADR